MIRYLKQAEKDKSRRLWEAVFTEDSPEFVDFYYEEKGKRNRILVAEEGEEVVAMLHRNPMDVVVKDRLWRCDYVAGVATAARCRHQGYMSRLLAKSFGDMYGEGMGFCFLLPVDPAIYQPFDFTFISRMADFSMSDKGMRGLVGREFLERDEDAREAAGFAGRFLEERYEVYAMRDEEYYRLLNREVKSTGGDLILLRTKDEEERLAGIYAYYGPGGEEQRELLCYSDYVMAADLPKPGYMGRIINLEEFVSVIRLREDSKVEQAEFIMEVTDRQIRQNNGVFRWTLDRNGSSLQKIREDGSVPRFTVGIGELTAWLLGAGAGAQAPDCCQGAAELIKSLAGVYFDEIV